MVILHTIHYTAAHMIYTFYTLIYLRFEILKSGATNPPNRPAGSVTEYTFDQVNQFINDGRLKGKLVYTLWKEVDKSGKEIDDEFV